MSCSQCKSLHCSCSTCKFSYLNEPHQVAIGGEFIMCPACGAKYDWETNATEVNEYSYESHKHFNNLKDQS